jgi:NAD+ synthase (glutamine-hydrolysing)
MAELHVVSAQINPLVGDIDGNIALILEQSKAAADNNADLIVFPELCVTGYPPEDLLLRPSLQTRIERALESLKSSSHDIAMVVGFPFQEGDELFNMAALIADGEIQFRYAKHCLPNYQVFDEKRYFSPGQGPVAHVFKGIKLGFSICEDLWEGDPVNALAQAEVDLVINLNGSPFHLDKQVERETLLAQRAQEIGAPIVYVNQVGGQDELVFDGASFAVDKNGACVARSPFFLAYQMPFDFRLDDKSLKAQNEADAARPRPEGISVIYDALVLGVKDYVNKNGFKGVVLGLSGGIDSALTLAVAVDALGKDRVQAVMMPFRYTSDMSKDDAAEEAQRLGITYHSIGIEAIYEAFNDSLKGVFANCARDTTEENIQARSRGVLLMAISNKLGYLVLTTGNKSEMAVGYATLYGDMAGGLDVLKDVPKTVVFELARYRNTLSEVIPERVITRPPSAELAPDQIDEDSLPPYEVLDQILELYIEQDQSAEAIIARGFKEDEVKRVLRLVDLNEYKRRQAPIGIRISRRAFGRDRRYPITNGWRIGD